jgi:predicted enzyme related to lactoylglutathione lyase
MGNRPTHFEIPVDDADRAEKFYTDAFGWTINRFPGAPSYYGLASTGDTSEPGIDGALYQRDEMTETMLTMSVDSIESATEKIQAAGGTLVTPKAAVPGVGWFAQFKDTEGNIIGIFLSDESATM